MWITTAERCREIDDRARDEFGITTESLMERAGLAVFEAARSLLPRGGRMAVVCGKGNNGGDGFVVARLAMEAGYTVDCLVAADEDCLSPDARVRLEVARKGGLNPVFASDERWSKKLDCLACKNVIVDAVLGTGVRGCVEGLAQQAIRAINRSGVPVVAVDLPSGILCDTGEELGDSVWAVRTVTFGLPKPFLFQGTGLEHSGHWTVADIGFPSELLEQPTDKKLLDADWVGCMLPERTRASHKGDNGTVLIVAGSRRFPGAASLAARGALRAGAGLVIVASVPSVCAAVSAQVPEAICMPLPESEGVITPEAAAAVLDASTSVDSAVFGPGLTTEPAAIEFLTSLWSSWRLPCCIDADALNAVSQGVRLPESECALTPHPGEMGRLMHSSSAEIQADRFGVAARAAQALGHAVLLKGAYSVVAAAGEPTLVNGTGNPGMATGGMGDVLAGIVGTLLAQGLPAYYAAACGAFWHGLAGDRCAHHIGPIGFTASDLANALPSARATIVEECDNKQSCQAETPVG